MHFTHRTEIALGILAICARHPGKSLTTRDIAGQIGIGKDYAAGIASILARNGLLNSVNGRIWNDIDPSTITLGSVLRITQPDFATLWAERKPGKRTNFIFDELVSAAQDKFIHLAEQHTVADLHQSQ